MMPRSQPSAANTPKTCSCFKSETRDPKCAAEFPVICPWWEYQLTRLITGDFSGPKVYGPQ